jgi:predicted ester cyclase
MTRQEVERLFDRRLEAWKGRDPEALAADHTEDGILQTPLAGEMRGRAAIENFYRAFLSSFPDVTVEQLDLVVEGDRAVQVVKVSGTNSGGFMDLPPTGRRFAFTGVSVYALRGNQIDHEMRIYDFTRFLIEIGVLKAKPV